MQPATQTRHTAKSARVGYLLPLDSAPGIVVKVTTRIPRVGAQHAAPQLGNHATFKRRSSIGFGNRGEVTD